MFKSPSLFLHVFYFFLPFFHHYFLDV
jgi:hypothetical protein